MPDLTPERLAELRALAAGATPGPWFAVVNDLIGGYAVATVDKPCSAHNHSAGEGDLADFVHEADARWIAAVSPDVVTALLDEIDMARASYDGAMADLAALVEVAAGAVSDETAHDPGVMGLMRYLAANYPAAGADGVLAVEVTADASRYVETMGKLEALARQRVQREAVAGDMAVELPGIEPDKVVDPMEALERSIAEAKAARKRHPQPRRNQ